MLTTGLPWWQHRQTVRRNSLTKRTKVTSATSFNRILEPVTAGLGAGMVLRSSCILTNISCSPQWSCCFSGFFYCTSSIVGHTPSRKSKAWPDLVRYTHRHNPHLLDFSQFRLSFLSNTWRSFCVCGYRNEYEVWRQGRELWEGWLLEDPTRCLLTN